MGAIYDPVAILVFMRFLESLDNRNFSNGMAEIIKMGLIRDSQLLKLLFTHNTESLRKPENAEQLQKIIQISMECKLEVVEHDKYEGGLRKILNFGHTIGHGVEFASNEKLLHGESVSVGMVLALQLQIQKAQSKERLLSAELNPRHEDKANERARWTELLEKTKQILGQYNLPTQIPTFLEHNRIIELMKGDKKKTENHEFQFVFVEEEGKAYEHTWPVSEDEVRQVISNQVLIEFMPKELKSQE